MPGMDWRLCALGLGRVQRLFMNSYLKENSKNQKTNHKEFSFINLNKFISIDYFFLFFGYCYLIFGFYYSLYTSFDHPVVTIGPYHRLAQLLKQELTNV